MVFEVTWVRLLIPVLGSTTYSFTIMLTTFIGGITIGSYLYSKINFRIKNLPLFIILTQAGIAAFMLLSLPVYSRIPYYLLSIANMLPRSEAYFPVYLFLQFSLCFLIIVIPTIFMGMSFPAIIKLTVTDIKDIGKTTGFVYAVNTAGTVTGALAAGLILIPLLGIKSTVEIGIYISIAAGGLLILTYKLQKHILTYLSFSILLLSSLFYYVFNSEWNHSIMLSEVPRMINSNKNTPENYQAFLEKIMPDEILFYKEGN
ncbi:MAG: fused MFS/spermidine synthase, partial [Bacteroidetes bacterium]|nr:fused MFS/spermidine synthase [Bacteroidota bacterium]